MAAVTRGRLALLGVLQRTSAAEVAVRCRVSVAAVSKWANGQARPRPEHRELLQAGFRIAPHCWLLARGPTMISTARR
jgi:transcriptional regulator with XRE-family HTH domain